jgi:hypothetical protein
MALWNGSKCSHPKCMLRFFNDPCLAMNPNLIFEIGSKVVSINMFRWKRNVILKGLCHQFFADFPCFFEHVCLI